MLITCIFRELHGIYGHRFTSNYSTGANASGIDDGLENAKAVWGSDLANFSNDPDAIKYAIKHVNTSRPPTSREFLALCQQAPKNEPAKLPYRSTPESHELGTQLINNMLKRLKYSDQRSYPERWIRNPRSQIQVDYIRDLAKRGYNRFREAIGKMVQDGICSEDGKFLQTAST